MWHSRYYLVLCLTWASECFKYTWFAIKMEAIASREAIARNETRKERKIETDHPLLQQATSLRFPKQIDSAHWIDRRVYGPIGSADRQIQRIGWIGSSGCFEAKQGFLRSGSDALGSVRSKPCS